MSYSESIKNCTLNVNEYIVSINITKYNMKSTQATPYWVTLVKHDPFNGESTSRTTNKFCTAQEALMRYACYLKDEVQSFNLEDAVLAEINHMGIEWHEDQQTGE